MNGTTVVPGDVFVDIKGKDANNTIPVDVINKVSSERYSMNVSLSYDGEFGFKAVLSLNVDAKNAGLYANLYYYNETTGELEFICEDKIATDGTAELTFSHASEYVIIIDDNAMETPDSDDVTAPETGDIDNTWKAWWLLACGVIALIAAFFVKKNKKA